MTELRAGGLVLYRRRPARVKDIHAGTGRIELETEGGEALKVRPKDVLLLHAGPVTLSDLRAPASMEDIDSVRELLSAETEGVDLATLADWLFGTATPAATWAAWEITTEGLHFEGTVDCIRARTSEQVVAEQERRQQAADEAAAWESFLTRISSGTCDPADADHLRDVEGLAEGRRQDCRLLKALGRAENPENAHALLLNIGWWTVTRVPYPARSGISSGVPAIRLDTPSLEGRTDLTHLTAFAIDDEGNRDPDDAVSIDDDGCLWVHVADVACLIPPDSEADVEARARGATLYLPDGPIPMLPPELVPRLGLGLAEDGVGPALSFRLELSPEETVLRADVIPSIVRVQRLTYEEAEPLLQTDQHLRRIDALTRQSGARRLAAGAIELDWPEARIRVDTSGDDPDIDIRRLAPLRSRQLVAESMILAGSGAAWFAREGDIPFPYSVQDSAAEDESEAAAPLPAGLPGAYALRRRQLPARVSGTPAPHRGLGLDAYGRTTSPMRRYVDLLVHQQLRAAATGAAPPLDETALMERAAQAESAARNVRAVERQANRHWTLVWLSQRSWQGRGILVDTRGRRGLLVCPEIALETWVNVGEGPAAGTEYDVNVKSVDLPRLDLHLELTAVD
ncbi:MAG TPA: RNB domain-containing ribonuclease [Candidatus Latescibacteria bacterium]|jgi:exoribonuclease-2|nr:RNB domain-containing ribonuclease [Candidatus Latescibacterota bacterium]HJP28997.1 RNB domain-containing ribonuclease [Candidatus Latescibacterota bacterium]